MLKIKLVSSVLMVCVLLMGCSSVDDMANEQSETKDSRELRVGDELWTFNANLYEAENIPVYPDEDSLRVLLDNPENVTITFYPDENDNQYIAQAGYSISWKLTRFYLMRDGETKTVTAREFSEVSETGPESPLIVLKGPANAEKDGITVGDNIITVEGTTPEKLLEAEAKMFLSLVEPYMGKYENVVSTPVDMPFANDSSDYS